MATKQGPDSISVLYKKPRLALRHGLTRPEIEPHELFLRSLYIEERRSERSGRRFILVLLE